MKGPPSLKFDLWVWTPIPMVIVPPHAWKQPPPPTFDPAAPGSHVLEREKRLGRLCVEV